MGEGSLPLKGIRVVDVAASIAAQAAGAIMAVLGADVVKVERPVEGDPARGLHKRDGEPLAASDYGWEVLAQGERSLALDLTNDVGLTLLRRLLVTADVLIVDDSSFAGGSGALSADEIKVLNPDLICASVTGAEGVNGGAEAPGLGSTVFWTGSGLMDLLHTPGGLLSGPESGGGEFPTGVALFAAIVTSLYVREQAGDAMPVSTSLVSNNVWANALYVQAALDGADFGHVAHVGDRPLSLGALAFEASDGRHLAFPRLRTEDAVVRLLLALELPSAEASRLAQGSAETLAARIRELLLGRTAAQWGRHLREQGVPVAAVSPLQELPTDPEVVESGSVAEAESGGYVVQPPLRMDLNVAAKPSPKVGEHSVELLRELGLSDEEINDLLHRGTVGTTSFGV